MTDDAKRPELEPEMDEPVFRPDDATPEQTDLGSVQDATAGQTEDWDTDAPGREDLSEGEPAFGEPVFSTDEPSPDPAEPDFSPESEAEQPGSSASDSSGSPEPEFRADSEAIQDADFRPLPDAAEPHFGQDGEQAVSPQGDIFQEPPESAGGPSPAESPGYGDAYDDDPAFGQALEAEAHDEAASGVDGPASAGWVNISPDSEMSVEPVPEKEYELFDETPAADVAMAPPPRRKLGRTGPVWVLGGIVLVIVAGLVWLAISRLTGGPEEVMQAAADPTVEQVEEATPTPEPATATPEAEPSPTRVTLPVLSNVRVGDTDGDGVLLRASPGRNGGFVAVIPEGEAAVVLEPEPEDVEYPADVDGHLWYRIRVPGLLDADGIPLAGWSASDFFIIAEQ